MSPYASDITSGSNLAPPTVNPISRKYSSQGSLSNSGPSRQELVRTSATSTPGGSRAVSPNPPKNLNHNGEVVRSSKSGMERCDKISEKSFDSGSSMKGLWDGSWASYGLNTLQEIVFTSISDTTDSNSRWSQVYKKEDWFGKGKGKGKAQNEWGPETRTQQIKAEIGIVKTENRDDMKDLKRAQMLEGRDNVNSKVDEAETYKRRTSFQDFRSEGLEEDKFTLVYVHVVQPQDTIQGVVLKFHSQMDVIKKANRLWSGDSIQLREKVYLPVDACAIKGKPCPPPQLDSLSDLTSSAPSSDLSESPYQSYGAWINDKSDNYSGNSKNNDENESHFIHVRWVLLESSSSIPVEVVRIPRKTLNYFPPRRRKSIASASVSSTRISSDIPSLCRSSTDSQRNSPSQKLSIAGHRSSPVTTTSTLSKQLSLSNSRESFSEINDRRGWLQGPGGVGTLGKNVRRPGPAKDMLNAWTRKKFPGIAIDSLPSSSAVDAESAQLSFNSEDVGPTAADSILTHPLSENSYGGLAFPNMNLNSVENWVRKIASKVQVPHNLKEDSIEMLDGAGSYDERSFESRVARSTRIPSSGMIKQEGTEITVRDRGKRRKNDKKE
ncbi:hypothetical protein Golomagni_00336 [Golovinomyces magnicellulatus]|nr:hypothetical protein Golomagni_00336 [Golovinomyces magnicellulatus]